VPPTPLLLYGAYGYTGELIAREAAARGWRPVLAGRDGAKLAPLAAELGCEERAFPLDDAEAVAAHLAGVDAVLHCAGPFARTAGAMAEACLRRRVHYLDITGEIEVFEALAARGAEARERGVMLLPGVGFDVVPTDCLAAHLAARLPGAVRLVLAFQASSRPSRGTATTMVENLGRGGAVRRGGRIVPVPTAWKTRLIDFGRGPVTAVTVPWGDVSTAWRSTGIGDVEVYTALPAGRLAALRAIRWLRPLAALRPVQGFLKRRIRAGPAGPGADARARGRTYVWGEVEDGEGRRAAARLTGPEGYRFTVLTALGAAEKVLAGEVRPGYATPSLAFGADFVLGFPGVERRDL
jgi:short subunit dehydrogenase-like uncharacterized protein